LVKEGCGGAAMAGKEDIVIFGDDDVVFGKVSFAVSVAELPD
jgi:hypothetical protein